MGISSVLVSGKFVSVAGLIGPKLDKYPFSNVSVLVTNPDRFSPLICGVNYVCGCFLLHFITFVGGGFPAYFSNLSPILREHIFCRF